MEPGLRYEIIDTVAAGNFTTVYRARDRKLAREVAVKQIHQQYLIDPEQLERYWADVRSLAELEHPRLLTIVEVIPSRGWLVSELMRGSLKRNAEGEPVDHEFLRTVLTACLEALEFLHANDLIHGDVKPSNILLDRQDSVKLGDFGLAHRASGEYGSPLEPDARYMAPEQFSSQFGPVGPATDLYLLGFSAYELLCGSRFESLLPELADRGSDSQALWAAWHVHPDRTLPEIGELLDNVPEDLSRVVQRLARKEPARRYGSAAEALEDLRPAPAASVDQPTEADESPEPKKPRVPTGVARARLGRRIRIGVVGVLTAALCVLVVLLVLSSNRRELARDAAGALCGVIRGVLLDQRKIELELPDEGGTKQFAFKQGDRFFVNKKERRLRDLQAGDEAVVSTRRDESGQEISVVSVFRPETHEGRIESISPDRAEFTLKVTEGADRGQELAIAVSRNIAIELNGEPTIEGRSVELNDLLKGDRVLVRHKGGVSGRAATELEVKRIVTLKGHVRNLNSIRRELTVSEDTDDRSQPLVLRFAPNCEVTINGRRAGDRKPYEPTDLRPGDHVTVSHDTEIVSVDAQRVRGQRGVVTKVGYSTRTLYVLLEDNTESTTVRVGAGCAVSLGGELIELGDLRAGDLVEITRHTAGIDSPLALTVSATRPPNPTKWAILVGIQGYDASLSRLAYPLANTRLLRQMLVNRYGVPLGQVAMLEDVGRERLKRGIEQLLGKVGADGEVVVYFAGHAYRDSEGKVYLAPKDVDLKRLTTSGVPLEWLVDQLDQSAAKTKLLLLDCCNDGKGSDLAGQPSTARMLRSLVDSSGRPALKTIWTLASCDNGQRGYAWPSRGCGLFAACLADAYSGKADADKNNRIEATELFAFLQRAMASAGAEVEHVQEPVLFPPR